MHRARHGSSPGESGAVRASARPPVGGAPDLWRGASTRGPVTLGGGCLAGLFAAARLRRIRASVPRSTLPPAQYQDPEAGLSASGAATSLPNGIPAAHPLLVLILEHRRRSGAASSSAMAPSMWSSEQFERVPMERRARLVACRLGKEVGEVDAKCEVMLFLGDGGIFLWYFTQHRSFDDIFRICRSFDSTKPFFSLKN